MRSWGALGLVGLAGMGACSRPARETATTRPVPVLAPSAPPVDSVAAPVPPAPPAPACGDPGNVFVYSSPEHAVHGHPLRVIAITDHAIDARLTVSGPKATIAGTSSEERHGGPPYFWMARVEAPAFGKWTATLSRSEACGGAELGKRTVNARDRTPPPPDSPLTALWPTQGAWSPSYENLYSAWIEAMFEAPLDAQVSYAALHEVLRDTDANFLFDHTDAAEDDQGIIIRPDCADLPYFLRAYFAFKLGLPFGWSRCSRGENGTVPTCTDFATSSDPFPPIDGKPQTAPDLGGPAARSPRTVGQQREAPRRALSLDARGRRAVRSGTHARVRRRDATTTRCASPPRRCARARSSRTRTGTCSSSRSAYRRPRAPAASCSRSTASRTARSRASASGAGTSSSRSTDARQRGLQAVPPRGARRGERDAPPEERGAPGLLGDRPVRRRRRGLLRQDGRRAVAVAARSDDGACSRRCRRSRSRSRRASSPSTTGGAFSRAESRPRTCPTGRRSSKPTGDWEDFSTPSRDLRLLVAIDVARALPGRVARRPTRYAMPAGKSPDAVRAELEARLEKELQSRTFEYTRTRRLDVEAHAPRRHRSPGGARDGLQPERLRGAPVGRAARDPRGLDVRGPRARRAGRQDGRIQSLVSRASTAAALRPFRDGRADFRPWVNGDAHVPV